MLMNKNKDLMLNDGDVTTYEWRQRLSNIKLSKTQILKIEQWREFLGWLLEPLQKPILPLMKK